LPSRPDAPEIKGLWFDTLFSLGLPSEPTLSRLSDNGLSQQRTNTIFIPSQIANGTQRSFRLNAYEVPIPSSDERKALSWDKEQVIELDISNITMTVSMDGFGRVCGLSFNDANDLFDAWNNAMKDNLG